MARKFNSETLEQLKKSVKSNRNTRLGFIKDLINREPLNPEEIKKLEEKIEEEQMFDGMLKYLKLLLENQNAISLNPEDEGFKTLNDLRNELQETQPEIPMRDKAIIYLNLYIEKQKKKLLPKMIPKFIKKLEKFNDLDFVKRQAKSTCIDFFDSINRLNGLTLKEEKKEEVKSEPKSKSKSEPKPKPKKPKG